MAWLSGINVHKYKVLAYGICSLLAGLTSILLTACLGSGQPSLGVGGLDMQNFIAVFVGGTRWGGGEGSIGGVLMGAAFVAVLTSGLNILNIPSYAQMVFTGGILVGAVALDTLRRNRALSSFFSIRKSPNSGRA